MDKNENFPKRKSSEFETASEDPLGILKSCREVVEHAQYLHIRPETLDMAANKIETRYKKEGLEAQEAHFGSTGSLTQDAQLIFLEDVVNFCFWPNKGEQRWEIKDASGGHWGGWYGLTACFQNGLKSGVPILNAKYIATLPEEAGRDFFRGENGVQIPLVEERMRNLREAGMVLDERFDGLFSNVLEAAGYDAVRLAQMLVEHFPSFRDISRLDSRDVIFLKRAQICPNDISYILKDSGMSMKGLERLTAFADYKLPQLLRMLGVFEYKKDLADRIDDREEITHDSMEEIEIRAATIWAIELIRQRIPEMSAGDIDNTIWLMSQTIQDEAKPFHRTRTIFY